MAAAYRAGAARLPFGMLRGYIGTDLPSKNPRIRHVTCPYTGEKIATVPAVNPDVTILHAQRADRRGNVAIDGIVGAAREAALAATRLLVTVEKIVDELPPAMNNVVHPALHGDGRLALPGRRLAFVRARRLCARQRLLPQVGLRSRATAASSRRGSTDTSAERLTIASFSPACGRPHDPAHCARRAQPGGVPALAPAAT